MNPETQPIRLGALLFPGFELLDLYGPLEMFGVLRERVSITLLAQKVGEVPSYQGPKGVADTALDAVGDLDILLLPGGWGTRREVENAELLELLRMRAAEARYVASVCTGSALLARAGILDGNRATSNKVAFEWVMTQGPRVDWVREARWVESGRFFTSSGVTAGMDMALALIARIFGREESLRIAAWTEYLWNEDSTKDPFAKRIPSRGI